MNEAQQCVDCGVDISERRRSGRCERCRSTHKQREYNNRRRQERSCFSPDASVDESILKFIDDPDDLLALTDRIAAYVRAAEFEDVAYMGTTVRRDILDVFMEDTRPRNRGHILPSHLRGPHQRGLIA